MGLFKGSIPGFYDLVSGFEAQGWGFRLQSAQLHQVGTVVSETKGTEHIQKPDMVTILCNPKAYRP